MEGYSACLRISFNRIIHLPKRYLFPHLKEPFYRTKCSSKLFLSTDSHQKKIHATKSMNHISKNSIEYGGLQLKTNDANVSKNTENSLKKRTAAPQMAVSKLSISMLQSAIFQANRERNRNFNLWQAFANRSFVLYPHMKFIDAAKILSAFSLMKFHHHKLLEAMCLNLPHHINSLQNNELVVFVSSLSRLRCDNIYVYQLCSQRTAKIVENFSPKQLLTAFAAFSSVGYWNLSLYKVIRMRLFDVYKNLDDRDLSRAFLACARFHIQDEKLFSLLATEVCRKIDSFSCRTLAIIANTYGRLGIRNELYVELLTGAVFKKRKEFEGRSIAMIFNFLSRVGCHKENLIQPFFEVVLRHSRSFNLHSLCLVASFIANQKTQYDKCLKKIGERVGELSEFLYPKAVASLVFSFSKASYSYGPLFYHAPLHLERFSKLYTCEQLAMLAKAYADLNIDNHLLNKLIKQELSRFSYTATHESSEPTNTTAAAAKVKTENNVFEAVESALGASEEERSRLLSLSSTIKWQKQLLVVPESNTDACLVDQDDKLRKNLEKHQEGGNFLREKNSNNECSFESKVTEAPLSVHESMKEVSEAKIMDNDLPNLKVEQLDFIAPMRSPSGFFNGKSSGIPYRPSIRSFVWIIKAFAKLNFYDEEVLEIVSEHFRRRCHEISSEDIPSILYSYSLFSFFNEEVVLTLLAKFQADILYGRYDCLSSRLGLIHYSLSSFDMDPNGFYIYKIHSARISSPDMSVACLPSLQKQQAARLDIATHSFKEYIANQIFSTRENAAAVKHEGAAGSSISTSPMRNEQPPSSYGDTLQDELFSCPDSSGFHYVFIPGLVEIISNSAEDNGYLDDDLNGKIRYVT